MKNKIGEREREREMNQYQSERKEATWQVNERSPCFLFKNVLKNETFFLIVLRLIDCVTLFDLLILKPVKPVRLGVHQANNVQVALSLSVQCTTYIPSGSDLLTYQPQVSKHTKYIHQIFKLPGYPNGIPQLSNLKKL